MRIIKSSRAIDANIASTINFILISGAIANIGLSIFGSSYKLPKYLAPISNIICGSLLLYWGNCQQKDEAISRMIQQQEKELIAREFAIATNQAKEQQLKPLELAPAPSQEQQDIISHSIKQSILNNLDKN